MRFSIIAPEVPTAQYKKAFDKIAPEMHVETGLEYEAPEKIECALVWRYPHGALTQFTNLKFIFSMGAGVDHVLSDKSIPKKLPVCRVVDPAMAFSMSNYIIMAVLNHHRRSYNYFEDQKNKVWSQFHHDDIPLKIGVLGTGHLGMDAAHKLHGLGFDVFGYSRTPKNTPFPSYSAGQLPEFLSKINVLICTVPFTPKTEGLLNKELFDQLAQPTYLINVSRGSVQVEDDILSALDQGKLNGAFLDVFEQEPLPTESKLWLHPKIKLTPHIASLTYADESVRQVLENCQRFEQGLRLLNLVDKDRMY